MTREQAIKWIREHSIDHIDAFTTKSELKDAEEAQLMAIKALEQEPKTGHWIRVDKTKVRCSECEVVHFIAQYPQSANINYCPNCGAKMIQTDSEKE